EGTSDIQRLVIARNLGGDCPGGSSKVMLDTAMAGALITKTRRSTMQKFQIGIMQRVPLMISSILPHAAVAHGDRETVSRLVDETLWRYDYAGLAERAGRAANMIKRLAVGQGDFVSTLAWNTPRHYELF